MSIAEKTFDMYVRRRLDAWGREFNLRQNDNPLGFRSKNMLATLIEHHGEMPERPTGYAPEVVPLPEWQIEELVRKVNAEGAHLAAVLRAYYGGSGRQRVERREAAEALMGRPVSVRSYYAYHDVAFGMIRMWLEEIARS